MSAELRSTDSSTAQADRRRDKIGAGVFGAWLAFVAAAFWLNFGASSVAAVADTAQVQQGLESWFAQRRAATAEATVFYFPDARCGCSTVSNEFAELKSRWSARGVAFASSTRAASMPAGADLAVFTANGHLAYAGPLHPGDFCSNGRTPADSVLDRISRATPIAPLVLEAACGCRA